MCHLFGRVFEAFQELSMLEGWILLFSTLSGTPIEVQFGI